MKVPPAAAAKYDPHLEARLSECVPEDRLEVLFCLVLAGGTSDVLPMQPGESGLAAAAH